MTIIGTIRNALNNVTTKSLDYDLILTGDLAKVGSELLSDLLKNDFNIDISSVHNDCELVICALKERNIRADGSGCSCSATVINSYIMKKLESKQLNKVIFVGTDTLLSLTS